MLGRGEAKWKGGNIKRAGVARTRKRRRGIRKERGIEAGGRASGRVVGRGIDWGEGYLTPTPSPAYRPCGLGLLHRHDTIVPPRPPPAARHHSP
ncbi:hypothetical protein E2C01_008506 [Portunus trituberculatus]|uniref:Uncharacterized protein n=1 Tax=Portunus trituberculatus TaxID=210409 RepID=A0A5B7D103_PORTR|nr:hypothetical protein [Portunus trituberculatus]